jgi:hypothetical protein
MIWDNTLQWKVYVQGNEQGYDDKIEEIEDLK